MVRFFPALSLSLMVFLSAAAPAQAEPVRYDFDKSHTQILFFSDHGGFSKQEGEFREFDGHFIFDQQKPENSSIDVTIQTASIDMDMEKWDAHMKNEDFFNVEKFPAMTFKSTEIKVTGENTADITGDLTLLGVTKPATLHVTHNKSGDNMRGTYVSGFSAVATIDRTLWGMNYGVPMMNPMIDIRIETEGSPVSEGEGDAPNQ